MWHCYWYMPVVATWEKATSVCGNNLKVVLCDNIVAVATNNFKLRILYLKTVTKS